MLVSMFAGAAALTAVIGVGLPGAGTHSALLPRGYLPARNTSTASVLGLMGVSRLRHDLGNMPALMQAVFEQGFADRAKAMNVPKANSDLALALVPRAFSAEGARREFGNWFALVLNEEQIAGVADVFGAPSVQRAKAATEHRALPHKDAEFQAFRTALQRDPMSGRRRVALEALVEVQSLDRLTATFMIESRASVIRTVALLSPERDRLDEQKRRTAEVRTSTESIEQAMPALREAAIVQLAWQLQDLDLFELQVLRRAFDTPAFGEFTHELQRGMQAYFSKAQSWLDLRYRRAEATLPLS